MAHTFVIAPDFSPERFAGWHMLNTLLQKRSNLALHLETPASYIEQAKLIDEKAPPLVYANPFDAAAFVREKGYKAIARPIGRYDEMVIVSSNKGDISSLEQLKKGATVAMADNRDVKLIGLRLLEAVDLTEEDLNFEITENYQAAARLVIQGKADVAFFMAEVYDTLSGLSKAQLNMLIESDLAAISHVLLVKEDFADADALKDVVLSLHKEADGQAVLAELGVESGFEPISEEEAEFMIDLMETLLD